MKPFLGKSSTCTHPASNKCKMSKLQLNSELVYCYEEEQSLHHLATVAKFVDPNKPWSCKYGRKKSEKIDVWLFSAWFHSGTKRSPIRMIAEIQKFCYHGNVGSHSSSLLYFHNVSLCLPGATLGARGFSCAVSGFGQVLKSAQRVFSRGFATLVFRPSAEHVSACGRRNEAHRRKREKTSVTQGSVALLRFNFALHLPFNLSTFHAGRIYP